MNECNNNAQKYYRPMDSSQLVLNNLNFYDSIKPKNPRNSFTVVATLNDQETGELLALATGTQACLRIYSDDIEDCHAESLLKRAYKRHLIDTIRSILYDKTLSSTEVERRISEKCAHNLILFITQFPCGLIKRYQGEEPLDEKGEVVKRKPGKGTNKDGKIFYVQKDTCNNKIKKWFQVGFQGSKLNELFGIKSKVKRIIIGDCEPETVDYLLYAEQLKAHLSSDCAELQEEPIIEIVEHSIRRKEFVFETFRQPQPVAVVWWARPTHNSRSDSHQAKRMKNDNSGRSELIVDGRKAGLTKKQCCSSSKMFLLKIGNHSMRQELAPLKKEFRLLKSSGVDHAQMD